MKEKRIEEIRLAHGGGGRLSHDLIEEVFLPIFGNDYLNPLNDSAMFEVPSSRLAFTTDSYVVDPIFFPGGDIGRLAVCGTVNDLSVVGAKPLFLSVGLIIEEGFLIEDLKRIVRSAKSAADEAGVLIVTGDTKVVEHGNADGVFINTSGIGVLREGLSISGAGAKTGDCIVVNGPIGRHGMAVVTAREDFGFRTKIVSDVAPLNHLVSAMSAVTDRIHVMRDATRGGIATVLNEIAKQSGVGIELDEETIPISEEVMGACELLGFDPLYVANEGVLVAFIHPDETEKVVNAMKKTLYGRGTTVIGRVAPGPKGKVVLRTRIGSHRIVDMLSGEQLPRIC
ncbi:MAG: hydrogenase expression/formation protein HypE [bacterium]